MSSTVLLGWEEVGKPYEWVKEYRNASRFSWCIWDHFAWKYADRLWGDTPHSKRIYFLGDDAVMKRLWKLVSDETIPEHERATLACTFDHTVIPAESIGRLTPLLRKFAIEMRMGDRLWEVASDLDGMAGRYPFFGFIGTTVADDVWKVPVPCESCGEIADVELYDLTGDQHYTWEEAMAQKEEDGGR